MTLHPRRSIASLWRSLGPQRRTLNLALQGGGAHGAFTWGVLDALLQDARFDYEGLSGTSAGALNAALFAHGWLEGGQSDPREGAREALSRFWTAVASQVPFEWFTQGNGETIALSPAGKLLMYWTGHFSPSQLNPLDLNPLRDLINKHIDVERLRAACPFKLFIAATQANSGKLRVFRETELSTDVLLASACLPKVHRPVEIDGEPYWDGGYSANPAVFPLFYDCDSRDVLLVLLSPLKHQTTPSTQEEINHRAMELAFSANFMREMRMFVHAARFASEGLLPFGGLGRLERRLLKMRFHMIDSQDLASLQRTETKMISHGPFLELLHDQGRDRALAWLAEHGQGVGQRGTVNLHKWFE